MIWSLTNWAMSLSSVAMKISVFFLANRYPKVAITSSASKPSNSKIGKTISPDNITDHLDLEDQVIRHGLPLDLVFSKFLLAMGRFPTSKQTATWVGLQSASILRKILQKPKTALVGWPLEFFRALTA